jgi:hypothetical protein
MSTRPIPVIQPVDDILYADIPVASVTLDGTGSTPSTGAADVVQWLWTLHSKPPNSTADLVNPTTATPQLINIDLPGSYLVSLQVTDNLGRSSHAGIEPIQSTNVPYGFSFPALSSMIAVRALTVNGLVKAAYGERQWLARGLWELVDRVDDHSSQLNTVPINGQVYADDIYEFTSGHGITIHHDVTFEPTINLTIPSGVIAAPRVQSPSGATFVQLGQSSGLSVGFDVDSRSRVIDLDGFVAQKNNICTDTGRTQTSVTLGATEKELPLRGGRSVVYAYEALRGGSVGNFSLAFTAGFNVSKFVTNPGNYLSIYLNVRKQGETSSVRLAELTFTPGGSVEIFGGGCAVSGLITSPYDTNPGGFSSHITSSATLSLGNGSYVPTASLLTALVGSVLAPNANVEFFFSAASNDPLTVVGNHNAAFTLMRSS